MTDPSKEAFFTCGREVLLFAEIMSDFGCWVWLAGGGAIASAGGGSFFWAYFWCSVRFLRKNPLPLNDLIFRGSYPHCRARVWGKWLFFLLRK